MDVQCANGISETEAKEKVLKGDFVIALFRACAFAFWQEIPKLCGFSAVQAGLAIADNLDHAQPNKRGRDRMRFLVAQSFTSFRRVSVTQEICAVGRQTM